MQAVFSSTLIGFDAKKVTVETHLSNHLPNIQIIGLAAKSVDESKERIRSSLTATNLVMPRKRIIINLSPADLPKNGSGLDLAIAVAILSASKQVQADISGFTVLGELGLDGSLKGVDGILSHLECAAANNIKSAMIPAQNYQQAMLQDKIKIFPFKTLREVYDFLTQNIQPKAPKLLSIQTPASFHNYSKIIEQGYAKQALIIAAAGGHNLMLEGPPGGGKSLMAKALVDLLPPLSDQERYEVTRIHSLKGNKSVSVNKRPFRSPHHSASHASVVGGGNTPSPGEITLAHKGVLFLDEIAEFDRRALEALRQPLEDKTITISRVNFTAQYPADFVLVATQNPCPCGNYGSNNPCRCTIQQISKYQNKISGPLMDRIDLYCFITPTPHNKLLSENITDDNKDVINTIINARKKQFERQGKLNCDLQADEILNKLTIKYSVKKHLIDSADKLNLSSRAFIKTIRVAQTIADIDNTQINNSHVSSALNYRKKSADFI